MSKSAFRPALAACAAFVVALTVPFATAQKSVPASAPPPETLKPAPSLDLASIDPSADPCNDFYKYSCGRFAATHPIPPDQAATSTGYLAYNLTEQEINSILTKYSAPDSKRSPNEQKIGDYYAACLNTAAIDKRDLAPIQPLLDEINKTGKLGLAPLVGKLQRMGVNVLFNYGEMQDFKNSTKQIATVDQGGLGLPEKDYYLRDGAKDKELRLQYSAHISKMLSFAGDPPQLALKEGRDILAFETLLAKASQSVTERRDPAAIYHMQSLDNFEQSLGPLDFDAFLEAVHSPKITEINEANLNFMPAMLAAAVSTDSATLRAYMRFQLVTAFASELPKSFDNENFQFYEHILSGAEVQRPRWKRCSGAVDGGLGEALGKVYVQQYFGGDAKAQTLQMVHDIEAAMEKDIDSVDWMSAPTKVRAKEKLHAVANKIGYPDKWRDYSSLSISPDDALADLEHANSFENDRQLARIGKPVDHTEFDMSPPTVDAYYNPSMNDINFPAGILQPPFFDPKGDLAENYGHIGAVIGHELTHGFDDEGRQFDAKGNLSDWWTAEDTKNYEAHSSCLVKEYGNFTAVDDVKVNGKLTLGENTADNGGLVLAFAAFMDRAKKEGVDLTSKTDGYTPAQRFYLAFGQDWCENTRDAAVRQRVLTDPHSPSHFRVNGVIVNQPGFAAAFGCKKGTPMVPVDACRVW